MFYIKCADILFQVNNRYNYIYEKCKDYILQTSEKPDLILEPSEERIQYSVDYKKKYDGEDISMAEAEFDAAPYPVYGSLPEFNAFWLHSAVVELDGAAYAFTANPGTGKTTHIHLWKQLYGDEIRIINGDNPIVRLKDGVFYAYGTPFCGKEGYQVNTGVPLKGLCFLERAETNSIERYDPSLAYARLLHDNFSISQSTLLAHMNLYEQFLEKVPVYILKCNMDPEAARVARKGLCGNG